MNNFRMIDFDYIKKPTFHANNDTQIFKEYGSFIRPYHKTYKTVNFRKLERNSLITCGFFSL